MNQQEERIKVRDDKEKKLEPAEKRSRLGREAKIGAGVILVLLIVLGVVVVMRFSDASPDNPPTMADRDAGKPKDGPKDDLFKGFNTKPMHGQPPKIVSAESAPSKPPKSFDSGLDKWKLPGNKPKLAENRYVTRSSHPPLMPETTPPAPKPKNDDPMKSYGGSRYDSAPIHRPAADPSGFALAGSSSDSKTPVPPHRDRSRLDDGSALLPPPPPARDASPRMASNDRFASSTPATPVGQYDNNRSYSRPSSEPIYDRDAPRRRDVSSYNFAPPPSLRHRNDGKYEVRPGDSYWKISENVYGVGSYYNALAEKNRDAGGDGQLTPGQLVMTPPVEELEKAYPELCPKAAHRETARDRATTVSTRQSYRSGKTYTVAEGDTLFAIARYELGKASRWVELYDLNRDVLGKDFNYLTPGMKLTLPDGEKNDDVLTRRPKNESWR